MNPGGIGNPFNVLESVLQKQTLAALYRAGFARGAEVQLDPNPLWVLGMRVCPDPNYEKEFWTQQGFEGYEMDPIVESLLIDENVEITDIISVNQLQKILKDDALGALMIAELRFSKKTIVGFKAKGLHNNQYLGCIIQLTTGRKITCTHNVDDAIIALFELKGLDEDITRGDKIHIDNRRLLALCFHHRHFVSPKYPNMSQFFIDGKPIYKPSSYSIDNITIPTGKFYGKMILIQHAQDRECWPDAARAYIKSVKEHLKESMIERFRIYWIENAFHLPALIPKAQTRYINYGTNLNQALTYLISWVEDNVSPPLGTHYKFNNEGALQLQDTASKRFGIQPVVQAFVKGSNRADIKKDQIVTLIGLAEAPPNTGYFIRAEWDFDNSGTFTYKENLSGNETKIQSSVDHSYNTPGIYFATFRVFMHQNGDKKDFLRHIVNHARMRIVVT